MRDPWHFLSPPPGQGCPLDGKAQEGPTVPWVRGQRRPRLPGEVLARPARPTAVLESAGTSTGRGRGGVRFSPLGGPLSALLSLMSLPAPGVAVLMSLCCLASSRLSRALTAPCPQGQGLALPALLTACPCPPNRLSLCSSPPVANTVFLKAVAFLGLDRGWLLVSEAHTLLLGQALLSQDVSCSGTKTFTEAFFHW